jgi:hypothetical protein
MSWITRNRQIYQATGVDLRLLKILPLRQFVLCEVGNIMRSERALGELKCASSIAWWSARQPMAAGNARCPDARARLGLLNHKLLR